MRHHELLSSVAEHLPAPARIVNAPPAPRTFEETGLPLDSLTQLLLKTLYSGDSTGIGVAEQLRLPWAIIEPLIEVARTELLIEVKGTAGSGTAGYRYALTDLGRSRAREYLEINQYLGAAPVPLYQYIAFMESVAADRGFIDRDRIAGGFSHLVVNQTVLDQLGPAVNSGKSVFLYGPPGNGKTVIAEGIGRALGGNLYVPHAVDVDGQIIKFFDPVNHEPIPEDEDEPVPLTAVANDRRWVQIRRPVVITGGELTLDMLDLSFNQISKFYEAPTQLKANGGVFVVDDFGRQRIRPRDLLNRWIVPLESRVDFLTLHTGKKFEVPFDVLIVFATNLKPETLADEAFLRRIPYKIYAKNPTLEEFTRIFELNCRKRALAFDPVIVEYLYRKYYQPRGMQMRACHPRDIVEQVIDLAKYHNIPPVITRELIDAACTSYFLEEQPEASIRKSRGAPIAELA